MPAQSWCGGDAFDPIGDDDVLACTEVASASERYVTLAELEAHPKGCQTGDFTDLATSIIGAVSDKVDEFYGHSVAPCLGTRCFKAKSSRIQIDALLRADAVETRPCGCNACDQPWTSIDIDRIVVGAAADLPPWKWLEDCDGIICRGDGVRITGVWGDRWPIMDGIKTAVIVVAAKVFQATRQNNEIVANALDGSTRFYVPDFTLNELSLLPRKPIRYRATAA